MPMRTWTIAFLIAVALHIGVALALASRPDLSTGYAANSGESGLEIGLGAAGTYADRAEQTAVEDAIEPKPVMEETKAEPEPEPEPEPKPKPKPAPKPEPKPVVEPKPVIKPAPPVRTVVKPAPTADDVTIAKQEPAVAATTAPAEQPTNEQAVEQPEPQAELAVDDPWSAARQRVSAANRATGSAADHKAGGRTSTSKDNFSALQNWLQMHKEYPAHLKKAKIQGTVVITFTFDRDGNVLKAAVEKSSGDAELDRAALDMLAKAEPLPPIPDSMGRETIKISIPVEYSLITR